MNLVELYEQTPVEKHKDIKVVGNRVFVKDDDGSVDEYLSDALGEQELWLIRSDKELKQSLARIEAGLSISA
jgi:hypothetical protein